MANDRPILEKHGERSFVVTVYTEDGSIGIGYRGTTPEQAIIKALPHVGSGFCSQCAGTRVSRRSSGTGDVIPCEACNGTGAAQVR